MLKLEGVSYRYPGAKHDSLHAISLDLADGTITCLAGPAGAGKSTLCLVASGLAPRVVGGTLIGSVSLEGEDVSRWPMHRFNESVVMGMQDPAGQLSLIADTVFEEVAFGPANLGVPRDEVLARTEEALGLVGVEALADRNPRRLSGGQQQLVVMAGLLAMRPRHLVLDEPVAHLDARGGAQIVDAIARIAASGTAVLVAEQRIEVMLPVCTSVAVIARGNIVSHGAAEDVLEDPAVGALGVDTPRLRLRRRLSEAGLDPGLLEAAS